jgi:hypothetical protein
MGNYWLNRRKNVKKTKPVLETKIQRYLFEPLDDFSKKMLAEQICRMLYEIRDSASPI